MKQHSIEDSKHIEGLRKGSYIDFKVLYDTYADMLYGFVFGLTRSESVAKDIVQETFIKVWINRERILPDLSFKSYIFKISKNNIIDRFRKKMSDPLFEDYMEYNYQLRSQGIDIEQKIDFDLFCEKLDIAKRNLSPRQREIFELNKEQGIQCAEIAAMLQISEQTVYNQLSAAMRILRKKQATPVLLFMYLLFFS